MPRILDCFLDSLSEGLSSLSLQKVFVLFEQLVGVVSFGPQSLASFLWALIQRQCPVLYAAGTSLS